MGDRQHAGRAQVQKLGGEEVDLGLDGAKLHASKHQHHPECGCAKQENDGCCSQNRGQKSRKRHGRPHARGCCPQHSGRIFLFYVQALPGATDRSHHHRDVEEHQRQHDRRERAIQLERTQRARIAQQCAKRHPDNHGRQHKRHHDEGAKERPPTKVQAVQHVRDWHAHCGTDERGERGLTDRKPEQSKRSRSRKDLGEASEIKGSPIRAVGATINEKPATQHPENRK